MKARAVGIVAVASTVWLSPLSGAEQTRGDHGSSGSGRTEAPAHPGGDGSGGGGTPTPQGPFRSSLGLAPARPSPSRRPFFGGGRGLALPLFDPLWWSELQPAADGPVVPNDTPATSGAPATPSILPSGPSSIQPSALSFRPPALAVISASGTLRLNVHPISAQLYVDGFYVGTVEEFSGPRPGLALPPGWHRLEFRAPGYLTPAINVTIDQDRTTTYEGELQPIER